VPPPSQIPAVREQAAAVLAEWEVCGEAAEPALLVVTELLTNALEYADAPIHITLGLSQIFVRVQVHDAATEPPQPRPHGPAPVRGHGLEIVAALALRQGWTPDPPGKTVWADVPTHWPT
jgi:two-component sensor histidine kinase